MICLRFVISVALIVVVAAAGAMKTASLDCAGTRKSCALFDVRTNADYQIDFPAKFNRNLARQVTNIEIKRSNFPYFPGNLFEVMPNLESITARGCGLVALNAYTFGAYSPYNVGGVKTLRLERNQLATLEPYTFSKSEQLFELRLGRNRLSNIDALAFYGLSRLDVLDMSHNQLTYLDLAVFTPLVSLRTVHLRENQFQAFNFDVFRDNVRLNYVNLADNGLTTLQATLVNSVARHIDLRTNQLLDISALGKMKGMDILQLSDNKNVDLKPTAFSEMAQLTQLRLDGVDLQRRQNSDYRFLTPLRLLRVLFLGRNELTSLSSLPNLPKLHNLVVNKNEISSLDANALKAQFPKLMQVNINNNRWDCPMLRNVVDQLKNLRIKLNFNSGEGQGRPAEGGANVEGVGCDGDAFISYPSVGGDADDYDIDERKKPVSDDLVCGRPTLPGSQYIYGGQKTVRGAWPWLVALHKQSGNTLTFLCGGTLISNKLVISAAHCITELPISQALLYIGSHDIRSATDTDYQRRGAEQLIPHPDYYQPDKTFSDADIALVILTLPVDYTKTIVPICLWPVGQTGQSIIAQKGVVAGWGRDDSNQATAIPSAVEMPVVSTLDCLTEDISYFQITSNRTLCVGEKNGKGPCHGDSGSGFVMKMGGRWVLRGVVSAGLPDPVTQTCDLTKYVVLADTVKFMDWILMYLNH